MLPIFRSAGQARLLARVYLGPTDAVTLADLARELDLDDGGLTREADRLERAGLVWSERIGRSRILHPRTQSPYYPELYGLLLKAFGPVTVVGPLLSSIAGVERAFVFGSWAARYLGRPGDEPVDIDVIVIGSAPRLELARIARELEPALGRDVNITRVSHSDWESAATGFLRDVRAGPLVEIDLVEPGGERE